MPAVDLHLHSSASDGRYPPADVVRRAAAAGLTALALTDHDTVAGLAEAVATGAALGVEVVAGCEFSVAAPWGEMHLLGYFIPASSTRVEALLARERRKRLERAERIVQRLERLGVRISVDDVLTEADGAAVGRPHLARTLVGQGVVPDVQAAFHRYLGAGRSAFVPKELARVEEVVGLVREVGGVTSAAHLKDRGTQRSLTRLRAAGVDGVEVLHPAHDAETRDALERLAAELELLPTGGSDWHGDDPEAPDRAAIGSLNVPPAWLDGLRRLHERRVEPSEVPR